MKRIRIGVFGAGRGAHIAHNFALLDCDIVALCDFDGERREKGARSLGDAVVQYERFDEFIEHDMDAVIIANYFHEHAPFVIECFKRNLHVYCECISNGTMAEGAELARAFEKTESIFMLAENYPHMLFNREIKRVCDGGTLGKIVYAEGEYNHPVDPENTSFLKEYIYHEHHWRNYNPRTYYVTHSLAPIMAATGATPKRVTAFAAFAPIEGDVPTARMAGDRAAILTTQNDDGSVFRVTACSAFGGHHNSYRVCGTNGSIENLRGMGSTVMLRYNAWEKPDGMQEINSYTPSWNDRDEEKIKTSGHGGGDYLAARMFLECVRDGRQPEHPFDLHSAITLSSVAILGHRSMLEGGMPYDLPDFRREEDRLQYENDRLSPYYGTDGTPPSLPCCSHPDFRPTDEQMRLYREALGIGKQNNK